MMITRSLEKEIVKDKEQGLTDLEIGRKYKINYRQLEKIIRKAVGITVSSIKTEKKIKTWQPKDFKEEATTVWSFKNRGNWATHSGEYRGNWSPYIPRNVILKYSKPDDLVLDYFCGAGTTAVESKLLSRKCIAFDINEKAIELARKNLDFEIPAHFYKKPIYEPETFVGDARDLSFLSDNSIDLICAHPPYANIIQYTEKKDGDLSYFDIEHFLKKMEKVAQESFRVLKPGHQCAILIGDMRKHKHVIPLGFKLINVFLNAGFKLKELIIKRQHNCKTTGFWYANSIKFNFLLLAHEYLPIFEKPLSRDYYKVEEPSTQHSVVLPYIDKLTSRRKIDTIESTTVWILPTEDFQDSINENVIKRYSKKKIYQIIDFSFLKKEQGRDNEKIIPPKNDLIFIRTPFLLNSPSSAALTNQYLNDIKEFIQFNLDHLELDGYCVIQTKDIRIGDYIELTAKRIFDMLADNKNLHLKEIIIVTDEDNGYPGSEYETGNLKINHQYLLVYQKK